uniref:RING-type domain-containing protein n=1 Tax=Vitrella brassicaformis TaxID=1169539 RepID=A0A7S1K127_9ALVE|mmetsp:Transcript_31399/g.77813  ORF Transcript_31399/g.77813 Transcript_31399/m.77813 type:complete len:130 (+) Transcript_31399:623-1012(+)
MMDADTGRMLTDGTTSITNTPALTNTPVPALTNTLAPSSTNTPAPSNTPASNNAQVECPICTDSHPQDVVVTTSCCKHQLCRSCAWNTRFNNRRKGCPFCRRRLTMADIFPPMPPPSTNTNNHIDLNNQ